MSHIVTDRRRLLGRVRRIRGQVDALERAIKGGDERTTVLQQVAACRGAINGLMSTLLEGHIRGHLIDSARTPSRAEMAALSELARVLKSYIK